MLRQPGSTHSQKSSCSPAFFESSVSHFCIDKHTNHLAMLYPANPPHACTRAHVIPRTLARTRDGRSARAQTLTLHTTTRTTALCMNIYVRQSTGGMGCKVLWGAEDVPSGSADSSRPADAERSSAQNFLRTENRAWIQNFLRTSELNSNQNVWLSELVSISISE
jgi:hypothetical protein